VIANGSIDECGARVFPCSTEPLGERICYSRLFQNR